MSRIDFILNSVSGKSGVGISDWEAANNEEELKKNRITAVVSVLQIDLKQKELYKKMGIKSLVFPAQDHDGFDLSRFFEAANEFIASEVKTGNVLVHCAAGISRSTSIVISYLIKHHNMKFTEALKLCQSKRPCCCPNSGFKRQLLDFERWTIIN